MTLKSIFSPNFGLIMPMTKYRLLNQEELQNFEDEFVKYLVVNGIAAEDWRKMLEERPDDAQKIVDLFSDVVFEKIMREVQFLVIYRKSYIQSIQCLKDKMIMVAISTKNEDIDMTKVDWSSLDSFDGFEIHKAEKEYTKAREEELFDLTEIGYSLSDGKIYKALMMASIND